MKGKQMQEKKKKKIQVKILDFRRHMAQLTRYQYQVTHVQIAKISE